jgi:hypothetical protein
LRTTDSAPSARRRSVFSPSVLPADATHCDDGRVRDVDAGQGEALLKEHHHAT